MKLKRYAGNPILRTSSNWWESEVVLNPGATMYQDKVYLLYRAQGRDGISRLGLATSSDGFNFERFAKPVFEGDENNRFERLGVEDARMTKIGDDCYICYTAASVYPLSEADKAPPLIALPPELSHVVPPYRVRATIVKTDDFKNFERVCVALPETDTKDLAIFPGRISGKYFMLHRIYPHMCLACSDDLRHWQDLGILARTREEFWDSERVGAGAPPIRTSKGWLLFYHGTDRTHTYRLGTMLLDLNDPSRILYRSDEPIFEPEEPYEKEGHVKNVVFTCGVVERDDQYFVYYGAADKAIGLATIEKDAFLASLG